MIKTRFISIILIFSLVGISQASLFGQMVIYRFHVDGVTFRGKFIPFERSENSKQPVNANGFELSVYCMQYRQAAMPNNEGIWSGRRKRISEIALRSSLKKQYRKPRLGGITVFSGGCDLMFQIVRLAKHDTMRVYLKIDYNNVPPFGIKGRALKIPFTPGNYLLDLRNPASGTTNETGNWEHAPIDWRRAKMSEDWDPAKELWN